MELVLFDVLKEAVSIHQPLPRVIASEWESIHTLGTLTHFIYCMNIVLLAGASQHGMKFTTLLKISPGVSFVEPGFAVVSQLQNVLLL